MRVKTKYQSNIGMPYYDYESFGPFGQPKLKPAIGDYACEVEVVDDGQHIVIESVYVPDLDLRLTPAQLTTADKRALLINLKLH